MRYSQLFGKTIKDFPKDEVSLNAKLLLKGGFIDKLMSGSYTLLPLGFRVKEKIEQIVREEMDKTGANELLMPLLHPKNIWNETGRWETAKEVMYQFKKNEKEFALSFTHEEIVLDLARKHVSSYKDFPIKIYHFSTKFRSEVRAKSGILRGREFLMKDLYSLHTSQKDLDDYYKQITKAYVKVFKRMGFEDVRVVEAGGGVFTDNVTHEFQILIENGEDTIYYCDKCDFAQNDEISKVREGDNCPKCGGTIKSGKASEAGNIFRFGTSYSEKMDITYADEKDKKQFAFLGSYGIGITRAIGIAVELFHDDRGIVWPETIAPYQVHLLAINNKQETKNNKGESIYQQLQKEGIEVLFDDRKEVSAGEKFADCDLIGIPIRLVVSSKTLRQSSGQASDKVDPDKIGVEWKKRNSQKTELIGLQEAIKRLKNNF